jgi:hypothetical protein
MAFVFSNGNIAALVSGLEANRAISTLRLQYCWFSNDDSSENFATFMRTVTNLNLKHLDMGDDVPELCEAWVNDPNNVTVHGLILRHVGCREWATLVKSLQGMKSLRELSIAKLNGSLSRELFLRHMRNQWNLKIVTLRSGDACTDAAFLDKRQQRLVDAFGMRNTHLPTMLANPMVLDDGVYDCPDEMSIC